MNELSAGLERNFCVFPHHDFCWHGQVSLNHTKTHEAERLKTRKSKWPHLHSLMSCSSGLPHPGDEASRYVLMFLVTGWAFCEAALRLSADRRSGLLETLVPGSSCRVKSAYWTLACRQKGLKWRMSGQRSLGQVKTRSRRGLSLMGAMCWSCDSV